jgi:lysozyme family protein
LQRALRAVGFDLKDDEVIGRRTLEALNRTEQPEWNFAILCAFRSECAGYYRLWRF